MSPRTHAAKAVWLPALAALVVVSLGVRAAAGAASSDGGAVGGLDPAVLLSVAVMLVVAELGGELFARLRQPAGLGELAGGVIPWGPFVFCVAWGGGPGAGAGGAV